jgi:hypothetical protein
MGVINILKHELDNKLPHWLTQSDALTKSHDRIYNKHRKRYLDEQKAEREAADPNLKPGPHLFSERATPEWTEEDHPRGQPENAGQFADAGGGGSSAPSAGGAAPSKKQPYIPGLAPTAEEAAQMAAAAAANKKIALNDFTEDKIKLHRNIERDKSKADKFMEVWDQHVGVDPGEFKNEFLGGLNATMEVDHSYDEEDDGGPIENKLTIVGKLLDAADNEIGSYSREIDFLNNEATSAYFELKKGATGGGVGKTLLAANVAYYQKLGLDRVNTQANIDVGGYAWAKYGYVPTDDDWRTLQDSLLEDLGGAPVEVYSWGDMTSDQQSSIYDRWREDTFSDFENMEQEHWQESGRALEQAKSELADSFSSESQWAKNAVDKWSSEHPDTAAINRPTDLMDSISVDYDGDGEGRNDPDITIDRERLTLSDDEHDALHETLVNAFNGRAEDNAVDIMPSTSDVRAAQESYWDDAVDDAYKFKWAEDNGALPTTESDGDAEDEDLRALAEDSDPKAIWAIADSLKGKDLLLGTNWSGVLELHDPDTMTRFNAYVGKQRAE